MSEFSEHADSLEEFRRRMMENGLDEPEEDTAIMRKPRKSGPPYVLELIYDATSETVILQGNQAGLNHLLEIVKRLADPDEAVGAHAHLNSTSNLTRSDLPMVIQRVADDGSGGLNGL